MAQTQYIPFNGVHDLMEIGTQMDHAEIIPLYYKEGDETLEVEGTVGVFNDTQGCLIGTASDKYSLLQNQTVLEVLANEFDALNLTPIGQVINDYNRISVEVHFPEMQVDDADRNKPIFLGTKIMNSYNKSSTFKGFGFFHRTWCENGAYARTILGDPFSQFHYGDSLEEKAHLILSEYVQKLEVSSTLIQKTLALAQDKKVVFENVGQIVASLSEWTGMKRAGEGVYQFLLDEVPEDEMDISRYDLWNAFTAYASHQSGLSETARDGISKVAEAVLNPHTRLYPADVKNAPEEVQAIAA